MRAVSGKLPGDRAYLDRIDGILRSLPAGLGDGATLVGEALEECRAALAFVRANPGDGPRVARRLMELLADTLSCALLLEEAAAGLALGDRRKAVIAERFVNLRRGRPPGIDAKDDPALAVFDATIGYAAVPV